jgi:hypothetical protein
VDQAEVSFATEEEMIRVLESWPTRRLIEVWNQLPGERKVQRFENRHIALARIWKALSGSGAKRKTHSKRRKPPRTPGETAAQRILSLLQAEQGATLKALIEATGWQAHSLRGFISRKLSKEMGLNVTSVRRDGERVYGLAPTQSENTAAASALNEGGR